MPASFWGLVSPSLPRSAEILVVIFHISRPVYPRADVEPYMPFVGLQCCILYY